MNDIIDYLKNFVHILFITRSYLVLFEHLFLFLFFKTNNVLYQDRIGEKY